MKFSIPAALRHKRYLYLWLGLLISIAGSQMQISALFWHIRILTGNAATPGSGRNRAGTHPAGHRFFFRGRTGCGYA